MVRFIHTGDLHLGLQFKGVSFSKEKAEERRLELWETFERIVQKSIDDDVDFLFLAGDLFEEQYFTLGDIERLRDTLAKGENIEVIITAGNHDTLNRKSLYNMIDWPENIHIFQAENLSKKEFPDKNTVVYGYSWDKGEDNRKILEDFKGIKEGKNNILILHGDVLSRDSQYLPLDKNYMENLGFDYIGLGHIHKPTIFSDKMAYSGSPEPLDFGETGEHGIILGSIEGNKTQIEFLPFSKRMFLNKTVKINETMGYVDIIDELREVHSVDELQRNLYRVKLEGLVNRDLELDLKDIEKSLENDFYYMELIDNTIVDYDLESLEKENKGNIIGYFIEEMRKKGLEDKVTRQALYIGLEVLMENN